MKTEPLPQAEQRNKHHRGYSKVPLSTPSLPIEEVKKASRKRERKQENSSVIIELAGRLVLNGCCLSDTKRQ